MSKGWYGIGVMPQQRKDRHRKRDLDETWGLTQKQSEEESSTLIQAKTEEEQYHKFSQKFMITIGSTPWVPENKYGIERLKI